ncbi:DUF4294 domain-containing protein [Zeaxanthinibacter sp. PT1]|uniref:DUF4294 domain-containing protein n=1 Tax=Zeaxanthinibacter TaxID=561554 RepID=UPI00234AA920|nr:DUF4294 domain-containing protein [Zeaxanthinibacter sp. PT1]MDC6352350.1 DUF4294 domain-containing protein [Zeaxanthinibacter sp. PT1]
MRYKCIYILVMMLGSIGFSQVEEVELDSLAEKLIILEGDSTFQESIMLEEVVVFSPLEFKSYEDKLRYYILRRKTHKVYPYAKLASDRLVELNSRLGELQSKRKRRRYTREVQKFIEQEFSEELKKLTRTEGQILVKLIYRQTGITAFDLVKELRNGWRAFWYNTTASLFNISLKEEYHPDMVHEDYLIEDILQRAFAARHLERQEAKIDYDYATLTNKWSSEKKPEN